MKCSPRMGLCLALMGMAWPGLLPAAESAWANTHWILRAGAVTVDPRSSSLRLASGDRLIVDDDTHLSLEASLRVGENWAMELFLAPTLEHRLFTAGTAGRASFGSTEQFIEMLSIQYHFMPDGMFRPYVGAGVAYAEYNNFSPATLDIDRSIGAGVQAGLDIELTPRLLVNFGVRWADLDPDVSVSGASIGSARIDPMMYSAQIGWRFGKDDTRRTVQRRGGMGVPAPIPPPQPPKVARAMTIEPPVEMLASGEFDPCRGGDQASR